MLIERIYCPYCGPWNGHPHGVRMKKANNVTKKDWFNSPVQFWYNCPVCGAESPWANTPEEARARALHKANALQEPLTLEEVEALGKPFPAWIEYRGDRKNIYAAIIAATNDMRIHTSGYASLSSQRKDEYGVVFRYWISKPTDEERDAARWEE